MSNMPRLTKALAMQRLQRVLDEIPALKELRRGSPEFNKWQRDTRVAVENTFGESSSKVDDFNDIGYKMGWAFSGTPESSFQRAYTRGLERAAAVLESMIDEIDEYWEEDNQEPTSSEAPNVPALARTNQVFVIHGRDHGTMDSVARFLESFRVRSRNLTGAA